MLHTDPLKYAHNIDFLCCKYFCQFFFIVENCPCIFPHVFVLLLLVLFCFLSGWPRPGWTHWSSWAPRSPRSPRSPWKHRKRWATWPCRRAGKSFLQCQTAKCVPTTLNNAFTHTPPSPSPVVLVLYSPHFPSFSIHPTLHYKQCSHLRKFSPWCVHAHM